MNHKAAVILGQPGDVLAETLYTQAEAAFETVLLLNMSLSEACVWLKQPETEPPEVVFTLEESLQGLGSRLGYCSEGLLELPEQTVILASCWQHTATRLASRLKHPELLIGFSGLGLYTGQTAIELAPALQSRPDTLEKAQHVFERMQLQPIVVADTPGLILPRTLAMLVNEAVSALEEGVANPQDIDTAMKLGTNYPLGPLAWADCVGLKTILAILEHLHQTLGEDRYRPMPLLRQKALAGQSFYPTLQQQQQQQQEAFVSS